MRRCGKSIILATSSQILFQPYDACMNKWALRIGFFLILVLAAGGLPFPGLADDPSCARIDCLGKCVSKEDRNHMAIPMLCMQSYRCYKNIDCTVLEDGKCGWKKTPEFDECIAKLPANPVPPPR